MSRPPTPNHKLILALSRAKRERSLEPLWALPDLDALIPTLKPHDLYTLVVRTGLHDSLEFLSLATPTQIRSAMDFDCWNKDRLNLAKYLDWLSALTLLGFEKLGRVIEASDQELAALFLLRSTVIFNLKEGEPPDCGNVPFFRTPDTFFEIYPRQGVDEEIWRGVTTLLENLYRYNLNLARNTIMDAMWSTSLYLEETSYQLMKRRLEGEGFFDYVEALSIYKWIDPTQIKLGRTIHDPPTLGKEQQFPVPMEQEFKGPYTDALNTLPPPIRERITHSLAALLNRMAAADRVTADDEEGLKAVGALGHHCLNLGCAYVAKNNAAYFSRVVESISPVTLFQVGYSLIHQLKALAQTLSRSGHISLSPRTSTLLEGPYKRFYDELTHGHPRLTQELRGGKGSTYFTTLEEIRFASEVIEELSSLKGLLFRGMGMAPALLTTKGLVGCTKTHPGEVTLGDLFRTALMGYLAEGRFATEALSASQFKSALLALKELDAPSLTVDALAAVTAHLKEREQPAPNRLGRILRVFVEPLFSGVNHRHLLLVKER